MSCDSEADFLLLQANIPASIAERYRLEAERALRVMPFRDALKRIEMVYLKDIPSAAVPRLP